eukprot:10672368-Ditylum_brightwellii.AAC.1
MFIASVKPEAENHCCLKHINFDTFLNVPTMNNFLSSASATKDPCIAEVVPSDAVTVSAVVISFKGACFLFVTTIFTRLVMR